MERIQYEVTFNNSIYKLIHEKRKNSMLEEHTFQELRELCRDECL